MTIALPVTLPVTFDVGPAVHQRAGLSRYTQQLALALAEYCGPEITLRLFYNRHSGHQLPAALTSLPSQTLSLGQYAWRLSVLASQLVRAPYFPLQRALVDQQLYHATEHLLPRLSLPTVMTVHDLIFERYPQHHKLTNRVFLAAGMPLFVRATTHIIAVSRHTASDLNALYNVSPNKIEVIYEGVDAHFKPATPDELADIRNRYSPDRPYLLMVGTLEPRKNHRLALAALAQLKAANYPHRLVIAGGRGWLFEPVSAVVTELGLTNDVLFTGYVPNQDLPGLYSAADALLMPSQYEGFGLPLLEAMACGTPVICSRASSLPELAGDAAVLIPPNDADALAAAIRQVVDPPDFAAMLRQRGIAHAAQFTWHNAATHTAQLYQAVARHNERRHVPSS